MRYFWKSLGYISVSLAVSTSTAMAGAIPLATGLNRPQPILLDGNGANVYFGQLTQSPCAGELDSIPVSGGNIVQLSTAAALSDSGRCRGTDPIVLSGTSILYADGGYVTADIDRVDTPCGGSCTHLEHSISGGALFEAANGNAYFMSGFSTLNTVPVSGGASSSLISGYFIRSTALDQPNPNYAATATGFYFVDYYTKNAFRMDLSTHSVTTLMHGLPVEGIILTDSKNLYWSGEDQGQGLFAADKTSDCTIGTCVALLSGNIDSFIVDESESDNPDGSVFASDGTHLWHITKAGVAQSIYSGTGVKALATDGAKIYFLAGGGLKTLPVTATNSTAPRNVASGVTPQYWTLNNGFHWTEFSGDTPGTGAVFYVAQQSSQLDTLQYTLSANEALLYKCTALAAVYANMARTVLEAQAQHVAATGIKIDDFYRISGSGDPCATGGGAGDWTGNGTWQNPVQSNVTFGTKTTITASFDLTAQVANGPVLLQGTRTPRWLLATNTATVTHGLGPVSGISAYDPQTGTRVLLQANSGSYNPVLILDPKTNVWCAWVAECPNLVNDMRSTTLNFVASSLEPTQDFVAKFYIPATVRP